MEREKLGSRLGFILLSAGCAIGIGNVWKFPYLVGQNGGGVFVLFYLLFLVIMGVPIMSMEFALGRAAQKSPVFLYQQLEKPGQKWHWHGYLCMIGNYILMMFYTVVCGWMLYYFYASVSGQYLDMSSDQIAIFFNNSLSDPMIQVTCMVITAVAGFLIISRGLQAGLEKITKVMMLLLIILMIVLAGNSISLPGGGEGLRFYLSFDFDKLAERGIFNVILAAMNQSFFSLSIGMGAMAIFGSYIGKERALFGESANVAILDALVAFSAGLIIFPACAAYNVDVTSGPSLLFITLPNVFNNLPAGQIWGSLFFLFMIFAAFSTVLAVFELIISCCMDLFGWTRKKASYINILVMIILALPCALGFNLLSGIQPLGPGSTILDLEDFLVSNLILPLGSLVFLFFCVSRYGFGWDNFLKEVNTGKGLKIKNWMRPYLTYVLPLIVLTLFIIGLL